MGKFISSIPTLHWTNNHDMRNMKWQFFYCGNEKKSRKTDITSSWRTKYFFTVILSLLSLYCMLSHNSKMFLYLNGLNPCIKILDMFWNIGNFILWSEEGNKRSSCSDYSKYGSFILGQSEKQFKIQSHFRIFDLLIGEG